MATALRVGTEDNSPSPTGDPGPDALATVSGFFSAALTSTAGRLVAALQDPFHIGRVPLLAPGDSVTALMANV